MLDIRLGPLGIAVVEPRILGVSVGTHAHTQNPDTFTENPKTLRLDWSEMRGSYNGNL